MYENENGSKTAWPIYLMAALAAGAGLAWMLTRTSNGAGSLRARTRKVDDLLTMCDRASHELEDAVSKFAS